MFEKLPYKSKIEICKLYYCDTFKCIYSVPKEVYFSWSFVEFESIYGETRIKRAVIEEWFKDNIKLIRKKKLISITKRETVIV